MREIRRFFSRLLTFFRADKADAELTREISAHLQLLEDQFIAKGMTPKEACDAAKRAFVHSRANDAVARLRAAVSATDPRLRLSRVIRIDRHAENDAQMAGFAIKALGTIAAVTLMLGAAGTYSLISFTLASRTREIGIRTALGAAPLRIVRGMLSPAFMKVAVGIVLGSIPGTVLIYSILDRGTDYWIIAAVTAGVALFIIVVAMISCIWPVHRALKIQPTEALRTT